MEDTVEFECESVDVLNNLQWEKGVWLQENCVSQGSLGRQNL